MKNLDIGWFSTDATCGGTVSLEELRDSNLDRLTLTPQTFVLQECQSGNQLRLVVFGLLSITELTLLLSLSAFFFFCLLRYRHVFWSLGLWKQHLGRWNKDGLFLWSGGGVGEGVSINLLQIRTTITWNWRSAFTGKG